jgi:hypothetical protein
MAPSFQSAEPPQCPGRFTFKKEVQILFQQFEANILRFGKKICQFEFLSVNIS